MNPNNVNHFSSAGVGVTRKRSKFKRDSKVMTTFDSGKLIPLYWDEVLPGDNLKIKLNGVCRGLTPLYPVMDNSWLDTYCFFVPNRLIWQNWTRFMGDMSDSTENPFLPTQEYTVPQIKFNRTTRNDTMITGAVDILSYLGCPPVPSTGGNTQVSVSALPVRAYCKIWNEWFRDENFQIPIVYEKGNNTVDYVINSDYNISASKGGTLAPVNKFKDYFVSALPAPQRGQAVTLSLGDIAPVITGAPNQELLGLGDYPLMFYEFDDLDYTQPYGSGGLGQGFNTLFSSPSGYNVQSGDLVMDKTGDEPSQSSSTSKALVPNNLYADLSGVTAITVNQMRLAFQTQKYLETLARGGARYIETLYSLYGVKTSDARLQRSEYLGGKRIPISMQQVVQTSQSTSDSTLGDTSAFSLTTFSNNLCNHFFEEHGILMIVGCVRTDQSYSQGLSRQWLRKTRFDFYAPVFANLGEMPIYNKEIYLQGTPEDELPFGYQEAWAEYRYKPNLCTGLLSPTAPNNLSAWTYTLKFNSLPVLNKEFIMQSKQNIANTLAVQGDEGSQFICDLYVENTSIRVMPMYSVPGLIDHA